MIRKTYRIRRRITVAVALAASLTAWGAQPGLGFDGRSPDTREAAEQATVAVVVDARSPDTREASVRASSRYALDLSRAWLGIMGRDEAREGSLARAVADVRSPDTREAAELAKPGPGGLVDLRAPDTREAAHQTKPSSLVGPALAGYSDAEIPVLPGIGVAAPESVSADRFNWGDFGIGVGVALGSMLLFAGLAAGALVARKRRGESVRPATT